MRRSALTILHGRITSLLLLACYMIAVAPRVRAEQCGLCGDVNGDGEVNIVDALFVAQNTVGLRPVLDCPAQGDVKQDQNVNIVDALFIAQYTVNSRPILCFRIDSPTQLSLFSTSPIPVSGTLTGQAGVACNGVGATIGTGSFSATVPLTEGNTTIACVAQDDAGNVATATESVTLDTTPPRVVIQSPADGSKVSAAPTVVTGIVNDTVVGTVNGEQARVSCNGVDAPVSNRTFAAAGVPLIEGSNTITCMATDRAGNKASGSTTVTLDTSLRARINQLSGDLQSAPITAALANPLVVSLTDDAGRPVAGKPVVFQVLQNDGTVSGGAMNGRSVAVTTDANGQAQVHFTLGTRAGAGNNQVQASAVGFDGQVIFCATATTAGAAHIVVDSGNNQQGVVAQALPLPFSAIVIDQGSNRLPNVPVTFTATQGSGSFSGQPAVTANTDSDGRVQAVLTLGSDAGIENNLVEASFSGNTGAPAAFVASGELPGNPASTSISGVILDNTNAPVPGATLIIADTTLNTTSDQQGQFRITGVPVGRVRLFVDGSTVQRPGTWPNLEFEFITVAGQDSTVERGAIYLLPLEIPGGQPGDNQLCVDETRGGTLTLAEVPGFSLTIVPGSATFPNGVHHGCVTVTPVHSDKMPKVPNFGQQARFAVTIQPAGTLFNPPAPLAIPNAEALSPGQKTDMYSYDHDLEQFISIGTGTVSEDGTVIRSDPGVGVIKAGWHCGGNPAPTGDCCHCSPCEECVDGACVPTFDQSCDDGNPCTTGGTCAGGTCVSTGNAPSGTACDDGSFCTAPGKCDGAGNCIPGDPLDCSFLDDECNDGRCSEEDRQCEPDPKPDGTPLDDPQEGDCSTDVCMGGQRTSVPDDSDTPDEYCKTCEDGQVVPDDSNIPDDFYCNKCQDGEVVPDDSNTPDEFCKTCQDGQVVPDDSNIPEDFYCSKCQDGEIVPDDSNIPNDFYCKGCQDEQIVPDDSHLPPRGSCKGCQDGEEVPDDSNMPPRGSCMGCQDGKVVPDDDNVPPDVVPNDCQEPTCMNGELCATTCSDSEWNKWIDPAGDCLKVECSCVDTTPCSFGTFAITVDDEDKPINCGACSGTCKDGNGGCDCSKVRQLELSYRLSQGQMLPAGVEYKVMLGLNGHLMTASTSNVASQPSNIIVVETTELQFSVEIPPGTYDVLLVLPAALKFAPARSVTEVPVDASGVITINFDVPDGFEVSGTLAGPGAQAIAGATVRPASSATGTGPFDDFLLPTTGADGRFDLALEPGAYSLTVGPPPASGLVGTMVSASGTTGESLDLGQIVLGGQ